MLDPAIERRMRQEHYDKYEALVVKLGLERLRPLVPASRDEIIAALESGDRHLNSIPLVRWDKAVGYFLLALPPHRPCSDCPIRDSEKNKDYRPAVFRPTGLSIAERVSLLKHVATYYVAEAIREDLED